jgi:hypothetical protein
MGGGTPRTQGAFKPNGGGGSKVFKRSRDDGDDDG